MTFITLSLGDFMIIGSLLIDAFLEEILFGFTLSCAGVFSGEAFLVVLKIGTGTFFGCFFTDIYLKCIASIVS
jgi:hypothetical protein